MEEVQPEIDECAGASGMLLTVNIGMPGAPNKGYVCVRGSARMLERDLPHADAEESVIVDEEDPDAFLI